VNRDGGASPGTNGVGAWKAIPIPLGSGVSLPPVCTPDDDDDALATTLPLLLELLYIDGFTY